MKQLKRLLCIVLTLVLLFSSVPAALAEGEDGSDESARLVKKAGHKDDKPTPLTAGRKPTDKGKNMLVWDFSESPTGWSFFDRDGDGWCWEWNQDPDAKHYGGDRPNGVSGVMQSRSVIGSTPLDPDDWAISSGFSLEGCAGARLSVWAVGQIPRLSAEHFALYAGTAPDPEKMVQISAEFEAGAEFAEFSADLSRFIGERQVYVAIRHFNSRDLSFLNVDQVRVIAARDSATYNPFADVSEGKYYYRPVLWAYSHDPQITAGTDATHFSPDKECSRAQVMTLIWNAFGQPEPRIRDNPFADVYEGKYYYKAVLWALEQGITSGVDETHFGTNDLCTRAQVVTFIWSAFGKPEPGSSASNPFEDVKEGKYYYKAILWAVENGVASGTDGSQFGTGDICTRAQVVTFLYNALAD